MRWMQVTRVWLALLLLWPMLALAQVTTTTLTDTIYHADGTVAGGLVIVSWPAFTTEGGQAVAGGSTSATLSAGGLLTMQLAPNQGATPAGTFYTAVYHLDDGTQSREYWTVPVSATPVPLSSIRAAVLPATVAVQTASKSYVDTAVAAALAGHPITGGVTFVSKTGDAMLGPLALSGDPTTGNQAADKHYVDTAVAGVGSGLAQRVGIAPISSQVLVQPVGTEFQANHLNGVMYASQYASGLGGNGLANATGSPDCVQGCHLTMEQDYAGNEAVTPTSWGSTATQGTHVDDLRGGGRRSSFFNPFNRLMGGEDAGESVEVTTTRSASTVNQTTGSGYPTSIGLLVRHQGLTGGSNQFPQNIQGNNGPFFKSNYVALAVEGTYNTPGQHVLAPHSINCYGVGDCLIGSQTILASGGTRDSADEGTHPMDLQVHEDPVVFTGTCTTGCTAGSTALGVAVTAGAGTQGEGRFLMDVAAAKTISAGTLIGGAPNNTVIGPTATFAGTSFPVSVFLATTQVAPATAHSMAPGTITLAIGTSGLPSVYSTTTAALPQTNGVACVVDAPAPFTPTNFETATYSVVDATHLSLTLNKVHGPGTTIAVGGLCGYGLEQRVDTEKGLRQVFPVIGSGSGTALFYAGHLTDVAGVMGSTSAYANVSLPIASIARAGNTTTVTTTTSAPVDLNGLTLTIAGVADSSFNGQFVVTTTGPTTLTYQNAGGNATSSGGTAGVVTGNYALYPMAEVLGVYNAATNKVDGALTLAANGIAWATGDAVEEPHYFQEAVQADTEFVGQSVPRPTVPERAGIQYQDNVGPGMKGWSITNAAPVTNYFGNGGTHTAPDDAFEEQGVWNHVMEMQAGETGLFQVHCNSHGCGRWNSGYNLFELDSSGSVDTMRFQPGSSALSITLRGTSYSFTPQALTAGTVNAGTVTATALLGNLTGTATLAGGTIDGTAVGATTPAAGSFTTVATKTLNVTSDTVAAQTLSFLAPNLGTGNQFCQGFGRGITPHNSTFYCWFNTPIPYGSLETFAGGDPLQMKGSSVWLNGGPVAIGNAAAVGSALPGLLNVGSSAQFQVDANGNVKAANFAGILAGQTGVIGGKALAAGGCTSGTVTVPGAATGTPVVASASDGSLPNGLALLSAAVTATNTVTVQVCAVGAMTPAAVSYNVRVVQ